MRGLQTMAHHLHYYLRSKMDNLEANGFYFEN